MKISEIIPFLVKHFLQNYGFSVQCRFGIAHLIFSVHLQLDYKYLNSSQHHENHVVAKRSTKHLERNGRKSSIFQMAETMQ